MISVFKKSFLKISKINISHITSLPKKSQIRKTGVPMFSPTVNYSGPIDQA